MIDGKKMNNLAQQYEEQGFVLIQGKEDEFSALRSDFLRVFNEISFLNGAGEIKNDQDIISLYNVDNRKLWVAAYDQLRYLPGLYSLVDKPMMAILKDVCGLGFCAYTSKIAVRVDMPMGEGSSLAPAHQDYPTHQGSSNSVTIWIPLQDVTSTDGPIQILPGSHKSGISQDKRINEWSNKPGTLVKHKGLKGHWESSSHLDEQFQEVPMVSGQVLVFSTLLLHRSGVNMGDQIRYSLNIRLNDLTDPIYARRYYYLNETTSVRKSEVDFNVKFPKKK